MSQEPSASELFPALRTAGDYHAAPALRDGRRGIDKGREIVSLNLAFERSQQLRLSLLHFTIAHPNCLTGRITKRYFISLGGSMENPKPQEKKKDELSEDDLKGVTGGGVRMPQPEEPPPQRTPSPPDI